MSGEVPGESEDASRRTAWEVDGLAGVTVREIAVKSEACVTLGHCDCG